MKVWFFKTDWQSSNGWKVAYEVVVAQNCHMTFGATLADAIYMAHDLIACLKDEVDAEKFYDEPFEYLNDGIFDTDARNFYIGALDIDVDLILNPYVWRRTGDRAPNTVQHMRFKMMRRAFKLTYKNFRGVTNS